MAQIPTMPWVRISLALLGAALVRQTSAFSLMTSPSSTHHHNRAATSRIKDSSTSRITTRRRLWLYLPNHHGRYDDDVSSSFGAPIPSSPSAAAASTSSTTPATVPVMAHYLAAQFVKTLALKQEQQHAHDDDKTTIKLTTTMEDAAGTPVPASIEARTEAAAGAATTNDDPIQVVAAAAATTTMVSAAVKQTASPKVEVTTAATAHIMTEPVPVAESTEQIAEEIPSLVTIPEFAAASSETIIISSSSSSSSDNTSRSMGKVVAEADESLKATAHADPTLTDATIANATCFEQTVDTATPPPSLPTKLYAKNISKSGALSKTASKMNKYLPLVNSLDKAAPASFARKDESMAKTPFAKSTPLQQPVKIDAKIPLLATASMSTARNSTIDMTMNAVGPAPTALSVRVPVLAGVSSSTATVGRNSTIEIIAAAPVRNPAKLHKYLPRVPAETISRQSRMEVKKERREAGPTKVTKIKVSSDSTKTKNKYLPLLNSLDSIKTPPRSSNKQQHKNDSRGAPKGFGKSKAKESKGQWLPKSRPSAGDLKLKASIASPTVGKRDCVVEASAISDASNNTSSSSEVAASPSSLVTEFNSKPASSETHVASPFVRTHTAFVEPRSQRVLSIPKPVCGINASNSPSDVLTPAATTDITPCSANVTTAAVLAERPEPPLLASLTNDTSATPMAVKVPCNVNIPTGSLDTEDHVRQDIVISLDAPNEPSSVVAAKMASKLGPATQLITSIAGPLVSTRNLVLKIAAVDHILSVPVVINAPKDLSIPASVAEGVANLTAIILEPLPISPEHTVNLPNFIDATNKVQPEPNNQTDVRVDIDSSLEKNLTSRVDDEPAMMLPAPPKWMNSPFGKMPKAASPGVGVGYLDAIVGMSAPSPSYPKAPPAPIPVSVPVSVAGKLALHSSTRVGSTGSPPRSEMSYVVKPDIDLVSIAASMTRSLASNNSVILDVAHSVADAGLLSYESPLPEKFTAIDAEMEPEEVDVDGLDWRAFRAKLVLAEPRNADEDMLCDAMVDDCDDVDGIGELFFDRSAAKRKLEKMTPLNPSQWAYDSGRNIEQGTVILGGVEQDFGFGLRQQYFHKAAILVLDHQEDSFTKGIILNRPTDFELEDDLNPGVRWRVWFGGDVQGIHSDKPDLVCLHSLISKDAQKASIPIMNGLQWTTFTNAKRLVSTGTAHPEDFQVFCGYAGWGPGVLRSEVDRKSWYTVATDSQTLIQELAQIASSDPREAGLETWYMLMNMMGNEATAQKFDGGFDDMMLKEWSLQKLLSNVGGGCAGPKKRILDGKAGQIAVIVKHSVQDHGAERAYRADYDDMVGSLVRASAKGRSPFLLQDQELHKAIVLIIMDDEKLTVGAILNRPAAEGLDVPAAPKNRGVCCSQKVNMPLRFGGQYTLKNEEPLLWLHCSEKLRNANVGLPMNSMKGGIWKCKAEEVTRALSRGVATADDFIVVTGVCAWTKDGQKGGIQDELKTGTFDMVPISKTQAVWKCLTKQKVLRSTTLVENTAIANEAWSRAGWEASDSFPKLGENQDHLSQDDPFVFKCPVKVSALADEALDNWVATFLLGVPVEAFS